MKATLIALTVLVMCGCSKEAKTPVSGVVLRVSAASSLTNVLAEASKNFSKDHANTNVELNFAASGVLLKQIEEGAPVDLFVSASTKEMDALQSQGLIQQGSRVDIASNELVLVTGTSSDLKSWDGLLSAQVHKIAVSNPETVPSGRYAKETLQKRMLWERVQSKLVLGQDVRQTLGYMIRGDVDAAIVFTSDALMAASKVRVAARAVGGVDHSRIRYPIAVLGNSKRLTEAREFVQYLTSPKGQELFKKFGFSAPTP